MSIKDYIDEKEKEIEAYNQEHGFPNNPIVNGRQQSNIGIFRKYIESYVQNNPNLHKGTMTLMVRQLAPSPQGLPLEIYAFCRDKAWVTYEGVQADIFDHLLAILPAFNLRVCQAPTGDDVASLRRSLEPPAPT